MKAREEWSVLKSILFKKENAKLFKDNRAQWFQRISTCQLLSGSRVSQSALGYKGADLATDLTQFFSTGKVN